MGKKGDELMLKIKIIVVDRTRSAFLREGEAFYLRRLRRYANLEWVEVKPAPIKKGKTDQEILAAEGQSISKKLLPQDYLITLDRLGSAYDSEGLAARVEKLAQAHSALSFITGGPLGLSREILTRSHETLSLSKMTFTHEMSRFILLEQLYRAFTILNGEKYHK